MSKFVHTVFDPAVSSGQAVAPLLAPNCAFYSPNMPQVGASR